MKTVLQALGLFYILIFVSLVIFAFICEKTGKNKVLKIIIESGNKHPKIWNVCGFFFLASNYSYIYDNFYLNSKLICNINKKLNLKNVKIQFFVIYLII